MHRNFFINDPDAFTVSRQLIEEREIQVPLTLNEAEVSIALAAMSGGMFEIGDDLPTLGADPDRVALVTNPELLRMAKLGRAAIPIDLLSYRAEDEQPSIFLLREDAHQSVLAVFNWTDKPSSHSLSFEELQLPSGRGYGVQTVLNGGRYHVQGAEETLPPGRPIQVQSPAHSVILLKISDHSTPQAPSVTVAVPEHARIGEDLKFSASVDPNGVPAISYRWDFGDGTTEQGRQPRHTYTKAGNYTVRLLVEGVDDVPAEKQAAVSVSGNISIPPPTRYNPD
jgi:hypothetical protein